MTEFEIYTIERERLRGDMVWAVNHGYGPRGEADLIAYSWYVEGPDNQILIDSGHPENPDPLAEGLADLGVDESEIDDIVCTHLHIDHNGAFHRFPNATVHVQEDDVAHAINPVPHHRESSSSIDGPNEAVLHEIVDREQPRELMIHHRDFQLTDGFEVLLVPGHTPGFQTPVINTVKGKVGIFHSKYYTNWFPADRTFHPKGVEFSRNEWFDITEASGFYPEGVLTESTRTYLDNMHRIAQECDVVVPGHDPYIPEKLPEQWYFTGLTEQQVDEQEKEIYLEVKERRHERFPDLAEW